MFIVATIQIDEYISIQTLPFRKRQSVLVMFLSEIVSRFNKQDKPDL